MRRTAGSPVREPCLVALDRPACIVDEPKIEVVTSRRRLKRQFGIGINSDPVVSGTIGGGGHLEFAVIGDAAGRESKD